MEKVFGVILTKNEAHHIAACIDSLAWADEVMLADSYSTDGTLEIATKKGVLVTQHQFVNFSVNRNLALVDAEKAGADWIFFVDADERVTTELALEIAQAVKQGNVGWQVPRYNQMWGHTMRGGGWYPDYQLRLLKIGHAQYDPTREVHEIVQLNGPLGTLKHHLIHYNYTSLSHFLAKQRRYLEFEAQILYKNGIRPKPWTYISMPLREFRWRYITLHGYRDGRLGLLLCSLMAWYMFLTYLRLQRLLAN